MLKKAGIIVAASAAGILAFTPLAFAGSKGDDNGGSHHKDDKSNHSKSDKDDSGDHDGGNNKDDDGDTSKDNVSNDCEFGNAGGSPVADAVGGSSLLGGVGLVTSLATDATSQLNTLNCNNVNVTDLVDSDSNNDTTTRDQTRVEDSFNTDN